VEIIPGKSPSYQDKTPRLFLASDDQGLRKVLQTMRKMPKARTNDPSTGRTSVINRLTISIYALVDGHNQPDARLEVKEVSFCLNRLLL